MNVFIESIGAWFTSLSINKIIMLIMMIFMVIGAVDRVKGNQYGYGEKFEAGFKSIGSLALSMIGIVAATPIIAKIVSPLITPLYTLIGADPSMFATSILACDMGGYTLAMELASDPAIGNFAGLILGTTLGPTIVFSIPVALEIIPEKDFPYLGAGVMVGLATIPIGCIAGGLTMNLVTDHYISPEKIFINLIPVILLAGLLIIGLWFIPLKMISGFNVFGHCITIIVTMLCAIAVFQQITGIMFPVFNSMVLPGKNGITPLDSGLITCGHIGIVLIGAFPMVEWITRSFRPMLDKIGKMLKINNRASAGIICSFAHVIPALSLVKDMDAKGKLLCISFAVSAASIFGAHLGFTAGIDQSMVIPVLVNKLVGSISAIILANILSDKLLNKINSSF